MQNSGSRDTDEGARPRSSSSTVPPGRSTAPLVIVSERGRHSDEARRIVRAQAARASAAQSRVTRARNREEREGTVRETPQSPVPTGDTTPIASAPIETASSPGVDYVQKPLVTWLAGVLDITPGNLVQNVQTLSRPALSGASTLLSAGGSMASGLGSYAGFGQDTGDPGRPQLPRMLPRGFVILQQRIEISNNLATLLTRTACFDFGSPGVEDRLHQLLFDLIIGYIGRSLSIIPLPGHPIQGHLRIACTCITIFQGQRADGAAFAIENKYQQGLDAAWSEAVLLDQQALAEEKSAEASLWAVFMISVTTGSTANFFHKLLQDLFRDLQLQYWQQVRNILRDFIYPVSFLDQPCKNFYDSLQHIQVGAT